ncbi:extracellular solute-binding protein [Pseudoalteromonas sp. NBT06-2]|uniref:extracellular solute-binding protein n=1 Tax=Pseudoalteromonas sp. NBT06-2 TaxID=2025950 RepID=UPI001482DC8E|nr:extracellular solute-binding protein [Pseudoalteromonas sp. NBT06-2]
MKSNLLVFIALFASSVEVLAKSLEQLNIYSFRKLELIAPIVSSFEKESGIKVNLVHGKSKYLLKRLENDGEKSQADLLLTSDLSQLANKKHLLQSFSKFENLEHVNKNLVDDEQYWVSISIRARTIFSSVNTTLAVPEFYSDFNKKRYQGQFCIRDLSHSYNKELFASLLSIGEKEDTYWLQNPNKLLVKRPTGNDRDQLRALAEGKCQFAIANHYYLDMLANSENKKDQLIASKLKRHWLKTHKGTTLISTTTAAITKYAPNKSNALVFMNYLLEDDTQKIYASQLFEFPVYTKNKQDQTTLENNNFKMIPDVKAVKASLSFLVNPSML